MLATLEGAATLEIAKGAIHQVASRLAREIGKAGFRVARRTEELDASREGTDHLRFRLWREICGGLDVDQATPMSVRKLTEAASALGYRSALVLSPGLHAMRRRKEQAKREAGIWVRVRATADNVVRNPQGLLTSGQPFSFPDVVALELQEMIGGLASSIDTALDPQCADAVRSAQKVMAAITAAGGGWAGFAAVVGSSGFAPYILAAQLSAWIPLVSGPMLTSFLAVLVNPVTLVAGLVSLGAWTVIRGRRTIRSQLSARLVVLLALRGMIHAEGAAGGLVACFRRVAKAGSLEDGEAARRIDQIEALLGRPIPEAPAAEPPGDWSGVAAKKPFSNVGETLVVGGLTAGEMLYHAAAINPEVLAAADFSRAVDMDGCLALAVNAELWLTQGSRVALRGYTAERIVMARLVEDGHAVEIAGTSNTPGFDLLVNGDEVQVKCGQSLDLLADHFTKYPDIPVIADRDLAEMASRSGAGWGAMVTTVEGFELPLVEELVERSLAAAEGLADPDLPLFAIATGAVRGAWNVWSGAIPLTDLPPTLMLDAGIRFLLSTAGGKAGAVAGLVLIGPAGALILGPAAGVAALMGGGATHNLIDRHLLRSGWHEHALHAASDLYHAVHEASVERVALLLERALHMGRAAANAPPGLRDWMYGRAIEDAIAAAESVLDLRIPETLGDAVALALECSRLAPTNATVLSARVRLLAILSDKPPLAQAMKSGAGYVGSLVRGWR